MCNTPLCWIFQPGQHSGFLDRERPSVRLGKYPNVAGRASVGEVRAISNRFWDWCRIARPREDMLSGTMDYRPPFLRPHLATGDQNQDGQDDLVYRDSRGHSLYSTRTRYWEVKSSRTRGSTFENSSAHLDGGLNAVFNRSKFSTTHCPSAVSMGILSLTMIPCCQPPHLGVDT